MKFLLFRFFKEKYKDRNPGMHYNLSGYCMKESKKEKIVWQRK